MVVIDFVLRVITTPRRLLAERQAALDARIPQRPLPPAHWEDEMLYLLPPFY